MTKSHQQCHIAKPDAGPTSLIGGERFVMAAPITQFKRKGRYYEFTFHTFRLFLTRHQELPLLRRWGRRLQCRHVGWAHCAGLGRPHATHRSRRGCSRTRHGPAIHPRCPPCSRRWGADGCVPQTSSAVVDARWARGHVRTVCAAFADRSGHSRGRHDDCVGAGVHHRTR